MLEGTGVVSWTYWASVGWRYLQLAVLGGLATGVPFALTFTNEARGQGLLLGLVFAAIALGLIVLVLVMRRPSARAAVAAVVALEPGGESTVAARCDRTTLAWLCSGPQRRYVYWAAERVVLRTNGEALEAYCGVPFSVPVLLKRMRLIELRPIRLESGVVEVISADATHLRFRLTTDGSAVLSALRDHL
jgi:hypothetical protein